MRTWILAVTLLLAAPGKAQTLSLPSQQPVGEWGVPFRASLHLGTTSLSGGMSEYMNNGAGLGGEFAVPLSPRCALETMAPRFAGQISRYR